MSARRIGPPVLPLLLGAAVLARVVVSCAASDPPAAGALDAGPEPDAAPPVLPAPDSGAALPCKGGGWCQVSLPPEQVALNGIWGSGLNDVWLVGSPDLTLHWDGTVLSPSKLHTMQTLFGVWGSGKDDVWTYSSGEALWHSNGYVDGGPGWTAYDAGAATDTWSDPVLGMWGSGPNDVWTVGASSLVSSTPTVRHSDGWKSGNPQFVGSFTGVSSDKLDPFTFNAIWGNANYELWIVGLGGKTRFGTKGDGGAAWIAVNSETSRDLYAVWGSGKGEVWAAGGGGTMRRFTRDAGSYVVSAVQVPTTETLYALTGFGAEDVWAVGAAGTVIHWDGTAWSLVEVPVANKAGADLFAVWGSSSADLWIGGRNTLLHRGNAPLPERSR